MKTVIGIDPGQKGAIAFYTHPELFVFDMPTLKVHEKFVIDPHSLHTLLENFAPMGALSVIEDVHAMPRQGVVSMFSFGRSLGTAIGALGFLSGPIKYVRPSVWKGAMGLKREKSAAIAKAVYTFPQYAAWFGRAKDDGRAEASLLAYFGYQHFTQKE